MSYVEKGRFEVIAHRGGSQEMPENTHAAFDHAANLSPHVSIELDIHLSRDDELVIIHDATLERTTNGHGKIKDLDFLEISKFDGGYFFTQDGGKSFPFRGGKVKIIRLVDVLTSYKNMRVSIDIKFPHDPMAEKLIKTIKSTNAWNRVIIGSEHHSILAEIRKMAPELCTGFSKREILRALIAEKSRFRFLTPKSPKVIQIPIRHSGLKVYSQLFLNSFHQIQKFMHIWTINDEATMRYLIQAGIDGIVTDAPSLLLRVAQELKKI